MTNYTKPVIVRVLNTRMPMRCVLTYFLRPVNSSTRISNCCLLVVIISLACGGCAVKHNTFHFTSDSPLVASSEPRTNMSEYGDRKLNRAPLPQFSSSLGNNTDKELSAELGPLYQNASESEKQVMASFFTNLIVLGDYKSTTGTFLEKLKQVTSAEDLREWAQKLIQSSAGKTNNSELWHGVTISFELIPPGIRTLAPTNIFVGAAIEKQPSPDHVVVAWGSGMDGFYGIMVGDVSFHPPRNRGFFRNWEDGIYVWHSDK